MRYFRFYGLVFFFLFSFFQANAQDNSGPALWTMSDEDTTIHIFGTIHLMNKDVPWETPKILGAFNGADQLVLELAPDQFDPALNQNLVVRYGLFLDGTKLPDILEDETYSKVTETVEGLGVPMTAVDIMKPWLVAVMIAVEAAKGHGFLPELGVDKTLMGKAEDIGKDIAGLETADFQIGLFSALAMDSQVLFLEATLKDVEILAQLFDGMRDAWLAGDLEELDALLNQGWEPFPDIKKAILDDRNQNWAVELAGMLDKPGTFFVAVGTGHLVGEGNLIELLEDEGYDLTRK